MAFTGKENHSVSLAEASSQTSAFRNKAAEGAVIGGFFGRDALKKVLDQTNCIGIRYYYAEKEDGTPTLVIAGVNKDGNDIEQGELLELSYPCPPFCSNSNSLNS